MSWVVERVASCASTMEEAARRAREGAAEGTVVVAETQTGGMGQRGRSWHSPPGGLYLSFVLRDVEPHLLTLALGVAVADTLEVAGVESRLKWVNDVQVGGRKVAGILARAESTGSRMDFVVAGIGINVNGHAADFPAPLRETATTVEDELSCESCIPDLEAVLLERIGHWLEILRADAREVVVAFRVRDALHGARVRIEAGESLEGTAEGIDDRGYLVVRSGGVPVTVSSGTVVVLD